MYNCHSSSQTGQGVVVQLPQLDKTLIFVQGLHFSWSQTIPGILIISSPVAWKLELCLLLGAPYQPSLNHPFTVSESFYKHFSESFK